MTEIKWGIESKQTSSHTFFAFIQQHLHVSDSGMCTTSGDTEVPDQHSTGIWPFRCENNMLLRCSPNSPFNPANLIPNHSFLSHLIITCTRFLAHFRCLF
ncbi:hypothetical protein FKM82_001873 [Ascaphus truei]